MFQSNNVFNINKSSFSNKLKIFRYYDCVKNPIYLSYSLNRNHQNFNAGFN